jgi:hypothetical protein
MGYEEICRRPNMWCWFNVVCLSLRGWGSASTAKPGTIEEPPQITKNGHVYIGLTAWQNKSGAKVTIDYKKRTIVIERSGHPTVTIDSNNENEYLIENSISYINAALVE